MFRICSNQSEAEEVRAKVNKTIDQVKDIGDNEEISYVNLFNLSSTQLEAEQKVKESILNKDSNNIRKNVYSAYWVISVRLEVEQQARAIKG